MAAKRMAQPCNRLRKGAATSHKALPTKPCAQLRRNRESRPPCKHRGNALIEVVASFLALTPFVVGIPLLGKQLDIEHKTFDSARYAVWERIVWRAGDTDNRDGERDVALESQDRLLGDPASGLISPAGLRARGISENLLWRDSTNKSLLDRQSDGAGVSLQQQKTPTPVIVGHLLVPGLAHGRQPQAVEDALGVNDLQLSQQTFYRAAVAVSLRSLLSRHSKSGQHDDVRSNTAVPFRLVQRASAAILSDTWSSLDDSTLRRRVDRLTTNELVASLELPGRLIAMQALAKGKPLYGEGQFAADVDLRPTSTVLPAAYLKRP